MKGQRVTPPIWAIVLGVFGVSRFCEKPPLSKARNLMRKGGLWNTFITIGRAGAFLKLLNVMPEGASGWADLGNQARVIDTLDRHEMEPEWLREMRRSNILAGLNGQGRVPQQTSRAVMQDMVTV